MNINPIRLISGYMGSGKDTVGQHLITGKGSYSWAIYRHPQNELKFPRSLGFRVAFADEVKREVKKELKLPDSFDVEKQKNEIVINDRTFRSFCIEKGCSKRKEDPYYWCRHTIDKIDFTDGMATITDWRFINEVEYANMIGDVATLRVFRKDVPIPPTTVLNDDPEHSLDLYRADFLLVPLEHHHEEFNVAKELFPQYKEYIYGEVLKGDF